MITRPEQHVEHEMVLGDPRRTPHGQQHTVHCDRVREIWLSASGQVPGRGSRSRRNCASTWLEDARRTSAYVRPTTRSRLRRCLFDGGVKNETNMVLDYAMVQRVELINEEYLQRIQPWNDDWILVPTLLKVFHVGVVNPFKRALRQTAPDDPVCASPAWANQCVVPCPALLDHGTCGRRMHNDAAVARRQCGKVRVRCLLGGAPHQHVHPGQCPPLAPDATTLEARVILARSCQEAAGAGKPRPGQDCSSVQCPALGAVVPLGGPRTSSQ